MPQARLKPLTLILILLTGMNQLSAQYGGGTGEPNDPYLIYEPNQIVEIGINQQDWDKHFKMMADLDMTSVTAYPIGVDDESFFSGSFDGNGYSILNLIMTGSLFGYVQGLDYDHVVIENVTFVNPQSGRAILADYLGLGVIQNCSVENGVVTYSYFSNIAGLVQRSDSVLRNCSYSGQVHREGTAHGDTGGLVARNFGIIENCYTEGEVSGRYSVGGLVGENFGSIRQCFSTAIVTGYRGVGGLLGNNYGNIRNCYSSSHVSGDQYIGGLIGSSSSIIINCYSDSVVSGNADVGGLVGFNFPSSVPTTLSSYWNTEISGLNTSVVGEGKTTAEMQTLSTFIDWGCNGSHWTIDFDQSAPRLSWEQQNGIAIIDCHFDLQGSGEPNDPYLIHEPNDLIQMSMFPLFWDSHFELMNDLDLSVIPGESYHPIGLSNMPFNGVFDGNFFTISNFNLNSNFYYSSGLFGSVSNRLTTSISTAIGDNAIIQNLILSDPNVQSTRTTGALVGRLDEGMIRYCGVENGLISSEYYAGGLVGYVGDNGTVQSCYSRADLVSGLNHVGGLLGSLDDGTVEHCYSQAQVVGDREVGGLVGSNFGLVKYCYSTGTVTGDTLVGGLIGRDFDCVISSYWDTDTSGLTESDGGVGKTTSEMQQIKTYLTWGCEPFWTIDNQQDQPRLIWENAPGVVMTDCFHSGSGTPSDPYLIYTADQLQAIGANPGQWNKHFKLMANIDLNSYTGPSLVTIGNSFKSFTGSFDGNFLEVLHAPIPLFGTLEASNTTEVILKDLTIRDPLNANLATRLNVGTVFNCHVLGGSSSGVGLIWNVLDGVVDGCSTSCQALGGAGLIGDNEGVIINCFSTSEVSGSSHVGGLVSRNLSGHIEKCYSAGTVNGNNNVGGLVGTNYSTIESCYSLSSVVGNDNVGGFVGTNVGQIVQCYSAGGVTGTTDVGGFSGHGGTVISVYWDKDSSGISTDSVAVGKTISQMFMASTYLGWGCDSIWTIDDQNDYPRLLWQQFADPVMSQCYSLQGNGDPNSPFLITTPQELNSIGVIPELLDKHFLLMNDLDLSQFIGTDFNRIGLDIDGYRFRGSFDGQGQSISNFTYDSEGAYHVGLFGYIDAPEADQVVIKDLVLSDPNITGKTYVGGLIGTLKKGTVLNCGVDNITIDTDAILDSSSYVGGLVGESHGIIKQCYSTGQIEARGNLGGLVARNYGEIHFSYTVTDLVGDSHIGGFASNNHGVIVNCFSAGQISANRFLTGFISSQHGNGLVIASYWDTDLSGETESPFGTGKTTSQMFDSSSFTGWGCDSVWTLDEGNGYPQLAWQQTSDPLLDNCYVYQGQGTLAQPYLIYTAEQLNWIGAIPGLSDKHFKLMADIDLEHFSDREFNTIGINYGDYIFNGSFDGNHHTISNLTISQPYCNNHGLFGYISAAQQDDIIIRDLTLEDPNVDANDYVGGLVGLLNQGTLRNCQVIDGHISGHRVIGGLVGSCSGNVFSCQTSGSIEGAGGLGGLLGGHAFGIVQYCSSSADVTAVQTPGIGAGGLMSSNYQGIVRDCFSTGDVLAYLNFVGGFISSNVNGSLIERCYSTGHVTGSGRAGGFIGYNSQSMIRNCFSFSDITDTSAADMGGLVGYNSEATIENSFSTGHLGVSTSPYHSSGGLVGESYQGIVIDSFWNTETSQHLTSSGGTGLTTAEMQMIQTFTNVGWDFLGESSNGQEDIWDICEGSSYPTLPFGNLIAGDFVCPGGVDLADLNVLAQVWLSESLTRDVWPLHGDGVVNMKDWAVQVGQSSGFSFEVGEFVNEWLKLGPDFSDIAPHGGDGLFNFIDFALLASNWLQN